ncbi:hypothetical protein ACVWZA_002516 [Sphingomonas sp. UYAg733]
MTLPPWIAKNAARVAAVALLLALVGALFALRSCGTARTARTAERLAVGQRGAALDSGADAVRTIGNAHAAETEIHNIVKDGTDAITAAPAGNSNDAADRATCRLRSYRHSDECVALLGPAS